jgi:hypothetical protein
MWAIRRRPRVKRWYGFAALMMTAAAVFLAGTVVLANSDNVYHACLTENGRLQNVTIDQAPECLQNQIPIQWNESGPAGPPGSSVFTPVSETTFGVTSDGCPADQWRLTVQSESGVALAWDTSECDDITTQPPFGPSFVEMNAFVDIDEVTDLDGTFFISDLLGKLTYLSDGMWRLNCLLNVAAEGPSSSFPPGPGNVRVNCAAFAPDGEETRLAEVLDSGALESQPIAFYR